MKPEFKFIISFLGWMRANSLTTVNVEEFTKVTDGVTKVSRLIRGDEETIFLSRKNQDVWNSKVAAKDLQIVQVDNAQLCLCIKNTGTIVGTIVVSE